MFLSYKLTFIKKKACKNFVYPFFYKKVVYKKVGLQRPKNKKVEGYSALIIRKFLKISFQVTEKHETENL